MQPQPYTVRILVFLVDIPASGPLGNPDPAGLPGVATMLNLLSSENFFKVSESVKPNHIPAYGAIKHLFAAQIEIAFETDRVE